MIVGKEHSEHIPSFVYTSLCVVLNIIFDQIYEFALRVGDACDLPPNTSMAGIPPEIKGLKKYFGLRNSCWIEQHGKGVKKKVDRVEVESPKPKRVLSSQVL